MGNVAFTKVIVDDLETEANFYSKVFKMKQLERIQADFGGGIDEIVLGTGKPTGSVLIVVKHLDGSTASKAGLIGFMSNDLEGVLERTKANGGTVQMEPIDIPGGSGRAAIVLDPEGQMIEVVQQG